MANYNQFESGKYTIVSDQVAVEMMGAVEKALSQNAARGFQAAEGDALQGVLALVQKGKAALIEANGKIYDERSGQVFDLEEFALQVQVKLAKLSFELYREQVFDSIAREQIEWDASIATSKQNLEMRAQEIEGRQVAIIRDRAEMERRVLVYKAQLVAEESTTLGFERAVLAAQLQTAEKKLEIVDSIYQVLAAEQLVIAAEQRRAASLQLVLEAERIVGQIKMDMVPYIERKAEAKLALADATTADIPVQQAIVELGYDKIAVNRAEEAARHTEKQRELTLYVLQEQAARAKSSLDILRAQSRRLVQEWSNHVKREVMEDSRDLHVAEDSFRLEVSLEKEKMDIEQKIALLKDEAAFLTMEYQNILRNMELRARNTYWLILEARMKNFKSTTDSLFSRDIREGFIVG